MSMLEQEDGEKNVRMTSQGVRGIIMWHMSPNYMRCGEAEDGITVGMPGKAVATSRAG
ncbi:hypothetical protein J007_02277 [Cryptococcus neoformans]|nr:hypothetical protein J007_02277 [Cryptococcus neoformans var. grubii]OXC62228.1 hypothetical protein C358_02347 [Cryptococcus neoformans var. grubii MW-RSA852]